ncbi:fibronectin type III domain-containing protein 10 [Antennarius striatus]|uniref:fibronectin type III domain-containing protein 10 n=1 Tax=Antennarius striatus TaxID=241820 RepID=UPI0035B2C939
MNSQSRTSLFALSALLLCASHQTSVSSSSASAASPQREADRNYSGTPQSWTEQSNVSSNYGNHSDDSTPSPPKIQEVTGQAASSIPTVRYEESDWVPSWSSEAEESPLCAYRVVQKGMDGELCFRNTLTTYQCQQEDCRMVVSAGNLHANILINGSVLLQWSHEDNFTLNEQDVKVEDSLSGQEWSGEPGTNLTREDRLGSNLLSGVRLPRRGGYELSCWWNGSYTQFECAGVHLGSTCRDFLLTELHENIPYRICLHPLARLDQVKRADQWNCVNFTLPPSGMQDIVIAMTAVGGAICVMLVIICLLVAYITENIMSPPVQRSYSYRSRSRH